MTDFRINVTLDPTAAARGTVVIERALRRLEGRGKTVGDSLNRAIAIGLASLGARRLLQFIDGFNRLENRIRIVTASTLELRGVTNALFQVAQRTRSSFEGTAELYTRVAISSRELGLSQKQLIDFTESLNQAFILSGANAREAEAGLVQFSQGISSGVLRGDELRSVLEQLPIVADVIAKELGVTRGAVRGLAYEGRVTSEVIIRAFKNSADELRSRFLKTIPTIGQAFVVLGNSVQKFAGDLDRSLGVTETLASAMISLADNIKSVASALTVAFSTFVAIRITPFVVSIVEATKAYLKFRRIIETGTAVKLGSPEALAQQAEFRARRVGEEQRAAAATAASARAAVENATALTLEERALLNNVAAWRARSVALADANAVGPFESEEQFGRRLLQTDVIPNVESRVRALLIQERTLRASIAADRSQAGGIVRQLAASMEERIALENTLQAAISRRTALAAQSQAIEAAQVTATQRQVESLKRLANLRTAATLNTDINLRREYAQQIRAARIELVASNIEAKKELAGNRFRNASKQAQIAVTDRETAAVIANTQAQLANLAARDAALGGKLGAADQRLALLEGARRERESLQRRLSAIGENEAGRIQAQVALLPALTVAQQKELALQKELVVATSAAAKARSAAAAASTVLGKATNALLAPFKYLFLFVKNNPIGVLLTVIALFGSTITTFGANLRTSTNGLGDFGDAARVVAGDVAKIVSQIADSAIAAFGLNSLGATVFFTIVRNGIKELVGDFRSATETVASIVDKVTAFILIRGALARKGLYGIANAVLALVEGNFNLIATTTNSIVTLITVQFKKIAIIAEGVLDRIVNIGAAIPKLFSFNPELVAEAVEDLKKQLDNFSELSPQASARLKELENFRVTVIPEIDLGRISTVGIDRFVGFFERILTGKTSGVFERYVSSVFDRAEKVAKERAGKVNADAPSPLDVSNIGNVVADLEREFDLTKKTTREREVQVRLQQTIERLLNAGTSVSPTAERTLSFLIRRNQAAQEEVELLDRLRQNERQSLESLFAAWRVAGLPLLNQRNQLAFKEARIPIEEFIQLSRQLERERNPFKAYTDDLKQQITFLTLTNDQYERQNELIAIRDDLISKGVVLTPDKVTEVLSLIAFRKELEELRRVIGDILPDFERIGKDIDRVKRLFAAGKINVDQYGAALRRLNIEALEGSLDVVSGFERGALRVGDTIADLASASENVLVNAFGAAEDAFVEFTKTGKLEFNSLLSSISSDLARLAFRAALLNVLSGTLLGGALGIPAKAVGGPVIGGKPYLVGEKGPELFVPSGSGAIETAQKTANLLDGLFPGFNTRRSSLAEPQSITAPSTPTAQLLNVTPIIEAPKAPDVRVNVEGPTILNLSDPDEVENFMKSRKGRQIIQNHIARNRERFAT